MLLHVCALRLDTMLQRQSGLKTTPLIHFVLGMPGAGLNVYVCARRARHKRASSSANLYL